MSRQYYRREVDHYFCVYFRQAGNFDSESEMLHRVLDISNALSPFRNTRDADQILLHLLTGFCV